MRSRLFSMETTFYLFNFCHVSSITHIMLGHLPSKHSMLVPKWMVQHQCIESCSSSSKKNLSGVHLRSGEGASDSPTIRWQIYHIHRKQDLLLLKSNTETTSILMLLD